MEFLAVLILGFFLFLIVGGVMGFAANARTRKLESQIQLLQREILLLKNNGVTPKTKVSPTKNKPKAKEISEKPIQEAKKTPEPAQNIKPEENREPVMAASTAQPPTVKAAQNVKPTPPIRNNSSAEKSVKKIKDFEFELGAKWTVWVGGLALLLGAVFLLRYSIEAGFFTPAMRVGMASIMGLALLGTGEWLRRGDNLPKSKSGEKIEFFENSYIPGILTAVGIFTLLGTVFAAYELYGFISAGPAFILMGAVSMLGLALGLIHSPWISAIGLAAAFATPILITSDDPSFSGLFLYLFVISAAAWALGRMRDWGWLVIASCLGAIFWLYYTIEYAQSGQNFYIWIAYLAMVLGVNFYLSNDRQLLQNDPQKSFINHNGRTAFILSGLLALAFYGLSLDAQLIDNRKLIFSTGLTAALAIFPLYKRFGIAHFWIAGLFALLFQGASEYGSIELACILGAILMIAGFYYCFRNITTYSSPRLETFSIYAATLTPALILAMSLESGEQISENTIGAALIGGAIMLGVIGFILKGKSRPAAWVTAFLWGSALAYFIAILILLERPYLNAALAAGIAIYACAFKFLSFNAARWISLTFGLLAVGITLAFSIGDDNAIAQTTIFNEIWIYLALPAALAFWAGREFRREKSDAASEGLIALSIASTGLFFIYQIRHYIHDGFVHKADVTFDELGLYVATGLAFSMGRKFMKLPKPDLTQNGVTSLLPLIFSALSWLTIGIFLFLICLIFAPLFNDATAINGGRYLNSLTLSYLLPCGMMGLMVWMFRREPAGLQTNTIRITSLIGMMVYVTSQIRVFFSGDRIALTHKFPDGWETYTITASWLFIGVVALAIGIRYKRKAFRIGSGIIIFMTVLKAFLVDMATLDGVLRAISFVILGVVLIIIGRVYQKLLFEQKH